MLRPIQHLQKRGSSIHSGCPSAFAPLPDSLSGAGNGDRTVRSQENAGQYARGVIIASLFEISAVNHRAAEVEHENL